MRPKLVAAVVILCAALVFALLNSQSVTVRFVFGEFRSSVAILIVMVFGLGLASGWLFATMRRRGK